MSGETCTGGSILAAVERKPEFSRKTKKKEGVAKLAQRTFSSVFTDLEQTQTEEFKGAFTLIDHNRDGFIDKEYLKDTYASLGETNVKDEELESILKEASGSINFTMFLNLFGEKLSGTDPKETLLTAFKIFDPEGKGHINKDYTFVFRIAFCTNNSETQMFQPSTIDAAGNLDYKLLCYTITHGEEKEG
ncbi:myosin light chain 5 [Dromaius novaehollandiae]|uniref:myosin light chain 5 n=1 Tax=Dromaius novaehollandiae TaxID=8790 RepID=UPI00312009B7